MEGVLSVPGFQIARFKCDVSTNVIAIAVSVVSLSMIQMPQMDQGCELWMSQVSVEQAAAEPSTAISLSCAGFCVPGLTYLFRSALYSAPSMSLEGELFKIVNSRLGIRSTNEWICLYMQYSLVLRVLRVWFQESNMETLPKRLNIIKGVF
jgi:hypothetical protein